MTVTYNEIDEYASRWIGNLIAAGHVAPGRVDTRSITELTAGDVRHVAQAHVFAGIAVWSAAARAAGWPDDAPLWSGSCPCQPFSQAGRGGGVTDERHLWPEWFRLIRECMPPVIVGEQVASPAGLGWLDAVFTDLEGAGYACAAADLCAASVGAPHQRQRLYFVAFANGERLEGLRLRLREWRSQQDLLEVRRRSEAGIVADDSLGGRQERRDQGGGDGTGSLDGGALGDAASPRYGYPEDAGADCGDEGARSREGTRSRREQPQRASTDDAGIVADTERNDGPGRIAQPHGWTPLEPDRHGAPGPTNGFWAPADWLPCTDGKARPVEPGTFPLAHGATARVGRLRAYGNAIVRPQAQAFLEVVIDMLTATDEPTTNLTKAIIL